MSPAVGPADPRLSRGPKPADGGLDRSEVGQLALYNAERERGIMHTPEWEQQMTDLQDRLDLQDSQLSAERVAADHKADAVRRVG